MTESRTTYHPTRGDGPAAPTGRRSRAFDIRSVLAGVFAVYAVLVGGAGLVPDPAGLVKSQGININLWTGIAMLVIAALFGLWVWLRPLEPVAAGVPGQGPERQDG